MSRIYPTRQEFLHSSRFYRVIPLCEEMVVDLDTPISIFKKAARGDWSYLLESVEGGEHLARYSFIGFDPLLICRGRGETVEITSAEGSRVVRGDQVELIRQTVAGLQAGPLPGTRFCGGAVGYFGYDLIRQRQELPETTVDDLGLPDCCFLVTRFVLIYDHVTRRLQLMAFIPVGDDPDGAYEGGVAALQELEARISGRPAGAGGSGQQLLCSSDASADYRAPGRPPDGGRQQAGIPSGYPVEGFPGVTSNITRERFLDNVRRAKEYIAAGDIFQVVLSQRLQQQVTADPFDIYRTLRSINPSPYLFYLQLGDLQLVGSSPEMLVRVEEDLVETRPIAGTRPRGRDRESDARLAEELLADPKERSEHIMLVDLGRNDVGRVASYGSVEVPSLLTVERYSHVIHLVSQVRGRLAAGYDACDALISCFPAGTLSGAPKIRAMEIIEELETTRRGPYGGAVGYLGFNGNLDTCITIRTLAIRDGVAYLQAGAGIVADSDPAAEYQETMNKAGALLQALSAGQRVR